MISTDPMGRKSIIYVQLCGDRPAEGRRHLIVATDMRAESSAQYDKQVPPRSAGQGFTVHCSCNSNIEQYPDPKRRGPIAP
jgi:hypothetical protein